jgi:hypothetical protein
MKLLLTLVVLWSLVTPAHAADEEFWESGNNFLRYCSSAEKDEKTMDMVEVEQSMRCVGFMEGLGCGRVCGN